MKQWFRHYLVLSGFLILLLGVILLPFMRSDWIYDPKVALVPMRGLQPGEVHLNWRDGLEYAWISPGEFQMGCTKVDEPCNDNERPPQRVVLARGFWLGRTEVTVDAFRLFEESEERKLSAVLPNFMLPRVVLAARGLPLYRPSQEPNFPKIDITWDEADRFCQWSGGRLPTEAEWEYAARGGKSQKYPWGNEAPITNKGARNGASFWPISNYPYSGRGPVEVGSFGANAFNLFDMAGNVLEWCLDTWHPSYDGAPSGGIAWLSQDRSLRVVRGGSWADPENWLRAAQRSYARVNNRLVVLGFRCARDTPPRSAPKPPSPVGR